MNVKGGAKYKLEWMLWWMNETAINRIGNEWGHALSRLIYFCDEELFASMGFVLFFNENIGG
jgi:hypothetical protein